MAKYKSIILTTKHLREIDACHESIEWFKKVFPKGIKISNDQDEMNDLVASINWYDNYGQPSFFHGFTVLEYLQYFLNTACDKGMYAYNNKYNSTTYPIMKDEYYAHEGGAFLSDCMFLRD